MDDLDFADGDLPDDDPDVVEGMRRLAVLRSHECSTPALPFLENSSCDKN